MSNIAGKRPLIGVLQFLIFGALGLLLIRIKSAPDAPREAVGWMFKIVGFFFIFVALAVLCAAIRSIAEKRRE